MKYVPPQKGYVGVLTPDLIWKEGLYRCNHVKMKSSGWALMAGSLIENRKFGHRHMHIGRMPHEDEGRDCADAFGSQGMPKMAS